jgi:peptidoglycan/LPS O-acetylase OafA/YrhL
MKYRTDIDGLRALAVIPVVLYHAGVPGFTGGFVGVDIFFVISGYLICGMIDAEIRNGSFSLGNFYKRRILRILPALFAVLLATGVLAYVYYLPVELIDFSRSLASAVGSVANFYFAQTVGYFDGPADTKPLLHTWSLGVEEQFYFIAPLLMLLVHRLAPRRVKLLFAVVAVVSFVAAIAMVNRNPTFAFYFTPFRAWELALGAMLSVRFFPVLESAFWKNVCGIAGLLLLFGVILFGSPSMPLLLMTSLAGLGAALVIASSESGLSMAGRLLSLRLPVGIGLISYSLYLWHWPLIVFQRTDMLFGPDEAGSTKLTLITLSVGLAYLSWKLVEQPFRSLPRQTSRAVIFGGAAASMASVFALCGLVFVLSGAPSRFPERVVQIGAYLNYDASAEFRSGRCFLLTRHQQLDTETCLTPDPARPNYLLVGDSHAAQLRFGLAAALPDVNVMQATASLCRPAVLPGSRYDTGTCRQLMEFVFNKFLADNKLDKVLLAGSWKDEDLPILSTTLDILKSRGIDVTVLGPIVEYDVALPRLLAGEILLDDPSLARARRTAGIRERDLVMRRLVTAQGANYVSVYDTLCHDDRCDEFVEADVPMQFDGGHLTPKGALEVGRRLAGVIEKDKKLARANDVSN